MRKKNLILITCIVLNFFQGVNAQTNPGTQGTKCSSCAPTGWIPANGSPDISDSISWAQFDLPWDVSVLNPPNGDTTWITAHSYESVLTEFSGLTIGNKYSLKMYYMTIATPDSITTTTIGTVLRYSMDGVLTTVPIIDSATWYLENISWEATDTVSTFEFLGGESSDQFEVDLVHISISPNDISLDCAKIDVSISDETICPGDSSILTANWASDTYYMWSTGDTTASITVKPSSTTTYSVTSTTNSCPTKVTIAVTPSDSSLFTYSSTTFCKGGGSNPTPVITVGQSGGTFSAAGSISVDANKGIIDLSLSTPGTYTVTYTSPCQQFSDVEVHIVDLPSVTFSYAGPYCQSDINPFPSFPSGSTPGNFTSGGFFGGLRFVNKSTGEVDIALSQVGTYTVTNTIGAGGGCPLTTATDIFVLNPSPTITVTSLTICSGDTTTLIANGTSDTYKWSTGEIGDTISITPLITTAYTVTDTTLGCISTVPDTVNVKPKNKLTANGGCDILKISGNVSSDINSNCTLDAGDQPLNNIYLKLYDANKKLIAQTYSSNGTYEFTIWDSIGTYTVEVDTVKKTYTSQCPSTGISSIVNVSRDNPHATNVNFNLTCKEVEDYGVINVVTFGRVFPGQAHHLIIDAGNLNNWYDFSCSDTISGTLQVTVSGPVTFDTVSYQALTPTIQSNVFTYNISDFYALNKQNDFGFLFSDFGLVFNTDTTVQGGEQVCVTVVLTTSANDITPENNTYKYCYNVRNSYDPNIKEVYPIDIEPGFEDWLTYTLHFQNTGNANAIDIRLKDTLDANLNLETFQVINYSHKNTILLYENRLTVFYPNIELPDSASNPEGSKGFVQYRIKPKTNLPLGTKINNTASIYFDYNAPIVTNTTVNEYKSVVTSITKNEEYSGMLNIYPNPSKGIFTVQSVNSGKYSVINGLGETVHEFTLNAEEKYMLNLENLSNGIYLVVGTNANELTHQKIILLK